MQADSGFMARDPARHPPAIAPTRPLPPANTLSVVAGTRGDYRVQMRHGVSTVRAGKRMTLGLIFHDAV